jgi:hypothetical protein
VTEEMSGGHHRTDAVKSAELGLDTMEKQRTTPTNVEAKLLRQRIRLPPVPKNETETLDVAGVVRDVVNVWSAARLQQQIVCIENT